MMVTVDPLQGARKGLVLGMFDGEKDKDFLLTKAAEAYQASTVTNLSGLIRGSGLTEKGKQKHRVFHGVDPDYSAVVVVNLGKHGVGYNPAEEVEEGRENVRTAVASAVRQLKDIGVTAVSVDPCGDAEAAAEAALMCTYAYNELKSEEKKKPKMDFQCFTKYSDDPDSVGAQWRRGALLGEGHNISKRLQEMPANVLTPTKFAQTAQEMFAGLDNVKVTVRDKAWAQEKKMESFLSVSKGSDEPPVFLEVQYNGGPEGAAPLAIVGKGITFDSGGISIKPAANMEDMRADMGGAACTLCAIYTAARLGIPMNVMGFMPLCDNMPSGTANKPGDVVVASNGKTIEVDNTDAEGRLVLADALVYAETFNPMGILDMATLTGSVIVALGSAAAGAFTNSTLFWETMHKAGTRTGDRVWRMPLFKHFTKQVQESHLADISNVSSGGRWGGSCTAAAFLKEFVTNDNWMHLDIAGVACLMGCKNSIPYMSSVMSGRPTRTIVEFIEGLSKKR